MSKPKPDPRHPWVDKLARYNAEVARGIVHTPEWDERMAKYQAEFDAGVAEEAQWHAEQAALTARERINLR